jgi:hypothetical protein
MTTIHDLDRIGNIPDSILDRRFCATIQFLPSISVVFVGLFRFVTVLGLGWLVACLNDVCYLFLVPTFPLSLYVFETSTSLSVFGFDDSPSLYTEFSALPTCVLGPDEGPSLSV